MLPSKDLEGVAEGADISSGRRDYRLVSHQKWHELSSLPKLIYGITLMMLSSRP